MWEKGRCGGITGRGPNWSVDVWLMEGGWGRKVVWEGARLQAELERGCVEG